MFFFVSSIRYKRVRISGKILPAQLFRKFSLVCICSRVKIDVLCLVCECKFLGHILKVLLISNKYLKGSNERGNGYVMTYQGSNRGTKRKVYSLYNGCSSTVFDRIGWFFVWCFILPVLDEKATIAVLGPTKLS